MGRRNLRWRCLALRHGVGARSGLYQVGVPFYVEAPARAEALRKAQRVLADWHLFFPRHDRIAVERTT